MRTVAGGELIQQFFFALLLIIASFNTFAESDVDQDIDNITFGPEFTLATPDGVPMLHSNKTEIKNAYLEALDNHLIEKQTEAAKFLFSTPGKFTSPNGWHFEVDTDPGVLEIKMNPMTLKESERFEDDINDAIFVTASNTGLIPSLFMGGGHLNIGIEQLLKHPMLLRNFLVDLYNNDFLNQGIFGYNLLAALPPSFFSEDDQRNIKKAFDFFDSSAEPDVDAFLSALRRAQYSVRDDYGNGGSRNKHTAISLNNTSKTNGTARIELRAFRPQADYHVWVKQIRLIQNRIKYLSLIDKPIKFNPVIPYMKDNEHPEDIQQTLVNPLIQPEQALRAFYTYLEEMGEDWYEHRYMIWPKWVKDIETGKSELENFEKTDWFLQREAQKAELRKVQRPNCSDLLKGA